MPEQKWCVTKRETEGLFENEVEYYAQEETFCRAPPEIVIAQGVSKQEALAMLTSIGPPELLCEGCYRVIWPVGG